MVVTLNPKKTLIALAVVTPLALTACGSSEEGNGQAASSSVTSATTVTSTGQDAVEESPEAAPAPESDEQAPADQAVPTIVNPFEDGTTIQPVELPPVEGGKPASDADIKAIEDLVGGFYTQTTLHGFMKYLPDNTCARVLEENNAYLRSQGLDPDQIDPLAGVPDMPLSEVPDFSGELGTFDGVKDVQIAGNEASASVTSTTNGVTQTSTMRFVREGDKWKFCNAAS